ncbi:MAG: TIGR03790 family protein [Bryobacteraceae bacterium]
MVRLAEWLGLALCGVAAAQPLLLVVNRNSPVSAEIGEYYARRRSIPPSRVCGIRTPVDESVGRDVYGRDIEAPVRKCLDSAGPVAYIVTTKGVPLRVKGTYGTEATTAAVDSELATLATLRLGRQLPLEGRVPNPFFAKLDRRFDQRQFPIYMVARLGAYDVATVKRMIDDCQRASNQGRFILDKKSDDSTRAGESWLAGASLRLPAARVIFDNTESVLEGQTNVIGYASWGSNDSNRKQRLGHFRWLPGSVATEFVSTDGRTLERPPAAWNLGTWEDNKSHFAGSPQSLAADFLDEGASAATGHTDEPYLAFTPRPDILLPAYYSGRTLGESFYLSIPALSWMNILLGDPLCTLGPPPNQAPKNGK